MKLKNIVAILLAFIWISISEFFRNQYLFHQLWVNHYSAMHLTFPEAPVNGAMWGVWALVFTIIIYTLLQKFSLLQTIALSWAIGFVLMWLVIGNLGVFPFPLLPYAIPLSLLEVIVAAFIISTLRIKKRR
jgi:hypothetical protein